MFTSLRQRAIAGLYDGVMRRYERFVRERKRQLLADLPGGTVVEIGPGTGANLEFFRPGTTWIGVEPNPHMHPRLLAKARQLGIEASLHQATAERIDVQSGSADAVVCTLVLCSVSDVPATLAEILRILRTGGRFLFIEHVAGPPGSWLRRWQSIATPCWRCVADGCHLNRDTAVALQQAAFASLDIDRFRVPSPPGIPLIAPHICGVAVK